MYRVNSIRPYVARASPRPVKAVTCKGFPGLTVEPCHYQGLAALCLSALSRVAACVAALVNTDGLVDDVFSALAFAHALPFRQGNIFPLFAAWIPNL